jgi:predicted patatin/cPLA2 family phospholipase
MQPTPLDVLRARRAGTASDAHRVVLVVEGGCMRGVIAAGAVTALDELDLAQRFDAVYGISAGAFNAAYMLAGQAAMGTSIYFEDLPTARFVSRRRILMGRRPMALDYTIDEIVAHRKRLDVAAVQAAAPEFHVLATCLEHKELHRPHGPLLEQLRAAGRVPLLAGPPVHLNGCRLYDGGLLDPLPVDLAIREGATHVVVLRTRPDGPSVVRHEHVERAMLAWLRRAHPETRSMPVMPGDRYQRQLAALPAGLTNRGDVLIQVLVPPPPGVSQSEMNPAVLRAGAWRGLAAVERAAGESVDRAALHAHGWRRPQGRETDSWVRARTASREGIAKHTASAPSDATALIVNAAVNPDSAG